MPEFWPGSLQQALQLVSWQYTGVTAWLPELDAEAVSVAVAVGEVVGAPLADSLEVAVVEGVGLKEGAEDGDVLNEPDAEGEGESEDDRDRDGVSDLDGLVDGVEHWLEFHAQPLEHVEPDGPESVPERH